MLYRECGAYTAREQPSHEGAAGYHGSYDGASVRGYLPQQGVLYRPPVDAGILRALSRYHAGLSCRQRAAADRGSARRARRSDTASCRVGGRDCGTGERAYLLGGAGTGGEERQAFTKSPRQLRQIHKACISEGYALFYHISGARPAQIYGRMVSQERHTSACQHGIYQQYQLLSHGSHRYGLCHSAVLYDPDGAPGRRGRAVLTGR